MQKINYYKTLVFGFSLLLVIFLNGCSKVKPDKPLETYPAFSSENSLSTINIPLEIPVAEIEKQINKQLNGLIYEDGGSDGNGRDNTQIKVWKREAISVTGDSSMFYIKVPLKVWARTSLNLNKLGINLSETKDTEFELNLNFASVLSIDSGYNITTETIGNGYEWIKKPKLQVGPLEISLGSFIGPKIEEAQMDISKKLDQEVGKRFSIKDQVRQGWVSIQRPINVSEEHGVWVKLNPTDILMTPLYFNDETISAVVGVKAHTETFVGSEPAMEQSSALPPLQIVNHIEDDFAITFAGKISHENAKQILSEKFVNKQYSFNKGKKQVTITGIGLYGSGEDMVIEADLEGSIDGKVYMTGKPYYDPATQSLIVKELDYDLDTKNSLARTANWLIKGRMVKNLEESLRIPLESQMALARTAIEKKLHHMIIAKGVTLNGTLDDIAPSDVYMTEDFIVALVKAKGKAAIKINGL